MQITSLNSATYDRPVRPSVESAWRERGQADSANTSLTPAGVKRKPENNTALPVIPRQRQFTEDGQSNNPEKSDLPSLNAELVQTQQSVGVYSAQVKTVAPTNDEALQRRKEVSSERRPRQIAYAAERAHRVYQEVAGQQSGRMVDEMV